MVIRIKRANASDVIVWSGEAYNMWASLMEAAHNLTFSAPLMESVGGKRGQVGDLA